MFARRASCSPIRALSTKAISCLIGRAPMTALDALSNRGVRQQMPARFRAISTRMYETTFAPSPTLKPSSVVRGQNPIEPCRPSHPSFATQSRKSEQHLLALRISGFALPNRGIFQRYRSKPVMLSKSGLQSPAKLPKPSPFTSPASMHARKASLSRKRPRRGMLLLVYFDVAVGTGDRCSRLQVRETHCPSLQLAPSHPKSGFSKEELDSGEAKVRRYQISLAGI
jgi:hypothetical protein